MHNPAVSKRREGKRVRSENTLGRNHNPTPHHQTLPLGLVLVGQIASGTRGTTLAQSYNTAQAALRDETGTRYTVAAVVAAVIPELHPKQCGKISSTNKMPNKKSSITCTVPFLVSTRSLTPDYDPYNVWPMISEDFLAHLPLRNLHWKSSNRPLRSIQSLHVEMRQYTPSGDEQPHQMPISLLEKPYLNMMLVKCDVILSIDFGLTSQDSDTYRNTVRKTIREWYNGVLSKRNQEWMILHVVPKSASVPGRPASRFTMKGSVYDKIRADFNSSKKDRYARTSTKGSC